MTMVMHRTGVALQWGGLAGSVAGVVTTVLFGLSVVASWVVAGVIAMVLDAVAIRTASDARAMGAAIAKLAVLLVALGAITLGGAASPADVPVPPDTGPLLLLLSILPSALGAIFRRVDS